MQNRENLDKDTYNKFVKNVNIQLVNLSNLNINKLNDNPDSTEKLFVDLKFENDKFSTSADVFNVNPQFNIQVSYNKDNNKCILFNLQFEYQLTYIVKDLEEFDKSYLELFIKRNVPVNIWPYARELISSLTTRMGYPALVIEPLKV